MRYLIVMLVLARSNCLPEQSRSEWLSCPVIADLPADAKWNAPLSERQRFQLRRCGAGKIIVIGYERNKAKPSLVFDTGDDYPSFLVHAQTVLVFQSLGGASDHVYVFSFTSGRPGIVLKTATKNIIQVTQSKKGVLVSVPPTTYPGPDGRFRKSPTPKEYSFPFAR